MPKKKHTESSAYTSIVSSYFDLVKKWEGGQPLNQLFTHPRKNNALFNGVMTLFRHLSQVDFVIDSFAQGRIRPRIRWLLRWAVNHFLFLERPPFPITADACVTFARKRFHKKEAAFVNAVCRKLTQHKPEDLKDWIRREAPLHVQCNLPSILYQKWQAQFGKEKRDYIASLIDSPAPLFVRLRVEAMPILAEYSELLQPLPPPPWAPQSQFCRCQDPQRFFHKCNLPEHYYYVQDPSTLLAPSLLDIQGDEAVGDLCAAPGGKAVYIAEQLGAKGILICADKSEQRLATVKKHLGKKDNCNLLVADARNPTFPPASFDKILLDVPCSNTGVIRRRPDVRWRFSQDSLQELSVLQRDVLEGSLPLLKAGGVLVYSTCSIEPEENKDQIDKLLSTFSGLEKEKEVQLLPSPLNDGAYACRLRKV